MWGAEGDEYKVGIATHAKSELGKETTTVTSPNLLQVKSARLLLLLPMRRTRYETL